jgi:autotransporter-associated beta strand protein
MGKQLIRSCVAILATLGLAVAQADELDWNNALGDHDFSNAGNFALRASSGYNFLNVSLNGSDRAIMSSGTVSVDDIRVGIHGDGQLDFTGGTLQCSRGSGDTRLGQNGNTGVINQSGGMWDINQDLAIGIGSGCTGIFNLSGGTVINGRGKFTVGESGSTGSMTISGGSFNTDGTARIYNDGTFAVVGSAATSIGIGTTGSTDGSWTQDSGSLLSVTVDQTTTGVTPIFIKDNGGGGNVTFENGSQLAVDFTGAFTNGGTFTVMEWEGALTDNGLAFASGVDTSIWSFNLDSVNKKLTVTALGEPYIYTNVTVNSISELRQFAKESNLTITMTPGTYWMNDGAGPVFLDFSGHNNTFNMAGVTIKMNTDQLPGYGSQTELFVLQVSGDGVVVDGLTLAMVKDPNNGLVDNYGNPREYHADRGCTVVLVSGSDTVVKNCDFTTGGSHPYGYGDAFGKGTRPNTDGVTDAAWMTHYKQSGFLITYGATNVVVDNVDLNMRSFGHGFYMQRGVRDILFKDCRVLGDEMIDSDIIIAHPEYQDWGFASYHAPIPEDIRISCHEDAFRIYPNGEEDENGYPYFVENVTITNCYVARMRQAIGCADGSGYLRVYDTELVENELGYSPSGNGTETTIKRCKGDALNGPLLFFQRSVDYPADIEIELTGDTPGHGVWPIALISGDDSRITLTSSAAPGVYSSDAYVNLSQKFREWRHRNDGGLDEYYRNNVQEYSRGNFVTNLTGQTLVFGPNASGNIGCVSPAGVINKGSGNQYIGTTLVPAKIEYEDTWSSPSNPTNVSWAQYNDDGSLLVPSPPVVVFSGTQVIDSDDALGGVEVDGGTIVSNGTLEVNPGFALQGETIYLLGDGNDGQGAVYSDGQNSTGTRLCSGSGSLNLLGDASIGVGIAGNELLVGTIYGTGNLTKIGAGQLTMEQSSSFDGRFQVLEGKVRARSNVVRNDLEIAPGAEFAFNGSWAVNQGAANSTVLDGTLCLNDRGATDANALSANIGSLSGSGEVTTTSTAATQTLYVNSSTEDSSFDGTTAGQITVVKNGVGTTLLLNGTCTHTEGTFVNEGLLGGTGSLSGDVTITSGAGLKANFSAPLVVGGSLNFVGDVFQILLPADIAEFDADVSKGWKIVDASAVSGFSAEQFTIHSVDFEASHPLEGGAFSVSVSSGDLELVFTPSSAQERWRFEQFETYSNTGDAADVADPDGDGYHNLVEYGTGMDPNVFNGNRVPMIGMSPDGSRMTVTFNRIADPALIYWVEATSFGLTSNDWNTIWSSTGASNTTGTVTVEDKERIENHWKRFLRLKLSN